MIRGTRIYLRMILPQDADRKYLAWMNDVQVNRFLESRLQKWNIQKLKRFITEINKSKNYLFLAIIDKDSNRHIGNIKLGPIHSAHRFADIGILIGEKDFWGRGFATEAIKLLKGYSFNTFKLHKLTAGAYSKNTGSIKAFKKAGFKIEGKRPKHFKYGSNYMDEILLGCINTKLHRTGGD